MASAGPSIGVEPLDTARKEHPVNLPVVVERRLADLRWAVRSLRRTPATSAIAILSLALGIGANTAIFSMINALLLRTLPVPAPQELRFVASNPAEPRVSWNYPDYVAFRDGAGVPLAAASGVRPIGLQTSDGRRRSRGTGAEPVRHRQLLRRDGRSARTRPALQRRRRQADWARRPTRCSATTTGAPASAATRASSGGRFASAAIRSRSSASCGAASREPTPRRCQASIVPVTMYSEVSREPAGRWNTRHYWWIRVIGRVPPGANVAALEARLTNIGRAQEEAERRENPRAGQRGRDLTIALLPGARGYTYPRTASRCRCWS